MQGFGPEVWSQQIAPRLDDFMGGAFEEICRDHARRYSQESLSAPAQEIGQIWSSDYDIDVAGRLLDGSMLYGECKWNRDRIGEGVLDKLMERAALTRYGQGNERRHFVLYSRNGFTETVRKGAKGDSRIVLHTPATVLAVGAVTSLQRRAKVPARKKGVARKGVQ
jgi:hypothetical protein